MFQHLTIVLSILFAMWIKLELVNLTNTELKAAAHQANFRITRKSEISKRFRFETANTKVGQGLSNLTLCLEIIPVKRKTNCTAWHKENLNEMNDLTFIYISYNNLGNATIEQFLKPAKVIKLADPQRIVEVSFAQCFGFQGKSRNVNLSRWGW